MNTETIEWHAVKDCLPDADTTVMVYAPDANDPVWLGYHDGSAWFVISDAGFFTMPEPVKAWAAMPEGPQRIWP